MIRRIISIDVGKTKSATNLHKLKYKKLNSLPGEFGKRRKLLIKHLLKKKNLRFHYENTVQKIFINCIISFQYKPSS